jgi:hypothetical protein
MRASILTALLLAPFTLEALAIEKGLVPGGYHAKANIHAIPAGGSFAHVGNKIHVLDVSGAHRHIHQASASINCYSPFAGIYRPLARVLNSRHRIN